MRQVIRALFLALCVLTSAPTAFAQGAPRTIICIDDVNDDFTNNAEGYLRAQYPNATIKRGGGTLTDCMGQLRNGDTLIIVCHGLNNGEGFRWGGNNYFGFGGGEDDLPVPPGFNNLRNITVRFISCWSARDPDGPTGADRPLTDKIRDAMGGAANGHPAPTGFTGVAFAQVNYRMTGGTPAQQAAARDCLNNNPGWQNNPPANRPNTGGQGQPANQQSAAQAQVNNNCPGAGGAVTITIPNQVSQPAGPNDQPPKTPGYKAPVDRPNYQFAAGSPGPTCAPPPYCGCSDPPEGISAEDEAGIPTLSFWALSAFGLALLTVGVVMLPRPTL